MNVYAFIMTAFMYSNSIGLESSTSGSLQAATPAGAFAFGFVWNKWTLTGKYRYAYLVAVLFLLVANILYFLVEKYKSNQTTALILLIAGRVCLGIGGARLMTRKFIVQCVKPWALTKYTAILVFMSQAGICLGPGINSFLMYAKPSTFVGVPVQQWNIYSLMCIFIYAALFVVFVIFFQGEPEVKKKEKDKSKPILQKIVIYNPQNDIELSIAQPSQKAVALNGSSYFKLGNSSGPTSS